MQISLGRILPILLLPLIISPFQNCTGTFDAVSNESDFCTLNPLDPSCIVTPPPASCVLDAVTIPHGGSVPRYHQAQATVSAPCELENRVCNNGQLSGTATHLACQTPCPKMVRVLPGVKVPQAADVIRFGTEVLTYGTAYPWMLSNQPFSVYSSNPRTVAFHMTSLDCGASWKREENLNPMKLDGRPQDVGNGPSTTVFNADASPMNQGYFSHINWEYWWRSRIYPYFDFGRGGLEYQALDAGKSIPNPVIGSPDLNKNDHFYSAAPVPNADGSVTLYFGGWRDFVFNSTQAQACTLDHNQATTTNGPTQKDCWCSDAEAAGISSDICTGDKIFVSTNSPAITGSNNPLEYKVYSKNASYSTSGWGPSKQFEPVVYSALVNTTCPTNRCPYKVLHTNDPSVIKTKSGLYVMYFTAGIGQITDGKMINYTYMATSTNGITYSNFSILKKHPQGTAYFPFGLNYNQANGTAKAYYDPYRDKIYIAFLATPDHPEVNNPNAHPDAWKLFMHEVSVAQPELVIKTLKVENKDVLFALPKNSVTLSQ